MKKQNINTKKFFYTLVCSILFVIACFALGEAYINYRLNPIGFSYLLFGFTCIITYILSIFVYETNQL